MFVSTRVVIDVESGTVIERRGYEYIGPVAKCCGASGQQKTAFANEQKVSSLLSVDAQKIFADNSNILKSITGALEPIVTAGPNQFGFSPEETAAMRTQTAELNAAAGQQATNALRGSLAAEGGGTTVLPSGSTAALEGDLALKEANKEAIDQAAITQKGFDVGRQNFFDSEGRMVAAPGALEAPEISADSAAMNATEGVSQAAGAITQANNAWMAPVAGLIGGIGGAALGKIPTGSSNKSASQ
jgi:hypothetical protein